MSSATTRNVGLEALAGVLGVGRRGRDLRDAGVAVELGRGDRGARVQVTDHAVDLAVDQLLRHGGALLRIAGVVFGEQFELGGLVADLHALGIQVLDGHLGAEFVVLAQVGDRAAGGADVADLDDERHRPGVRRAPARRRSGGVAAGAAGFFLLAASHQRQGGQSDRSPFQLHEEPPEHVEYDEEKPALDPGPATSSKFRAVHCARARAADPRAV